MKKLRIVFERDTGFMAYVIRWLTRSKINHVAIVYESDDWQAEWVTEAAVKGVRALPAGKRKWERVFWFKYDASPHIRAAQLYLGQNYDFTGFFLFGWFLLLGKILKAKVTRPGVSTKGQFCSEYIARILQQMMPIADPQWTTPEELLDLCETRPDLFESVL